MGGRALTGPRKRGRACPIHWKNSLFYEANTCKYIAKDARYDLGVKYFRKELDKADFLIIMVMVNTCWLIPHNSKWPLSTLPHFKCLTFSEFWVFWVPLWYPKIIMFKTMTPKLSNAVLHVPLWSLGEIWHPCEDWRFLHKFQWKVIFF